MQGQAALVDTHRMTIVGVDGLCPSFELERFVRRRRCGLLRVANDSAELSIGQGATFGFRS